jgi:hypothetical protein
MAWEANLCAEVWPPRLFCREFPGYALDDMEVNPTMSWDDVHRLELQLRARSAAIRRKGNDPRSCPGCGRAVEDGDGGMQLGGVTVHLGCLPALRGAEQPA